MIRERKWEEGNEPGRSEKQRIEKQRRVLESIKGA